MMEYIGSKEKRLSADSMKSLLIIALAIILLVIMVITFRSVYASNYQVEYVSYTVEQGDSLYTIVSEINDAYDGPYDVRDLIVMIREKNGIQSNVIKPGEEYLIPKVIASH